MGRKNELNTYLVLLLFMFIAFFILRSPAALGIDQATADTVFTLMPCVFLMILSIYGVAKTGGGMRLGSMVCVGFSLSWMIYLAYGEGLVTVEMLSGLTIQQVQVWVIALSAVFGAMISR